MLMAGIRGDVRSAKCTPIRSGLPPGASAGIRCDIGSDLVDWVTFHAFASAEELLAAYTQAMASAGIPLRTELPDPGPSWEDCWRGFAWEAFYWPRGDVAGGMNREGCFTDEDGRANLRYLWEVPRVSIEVVGAVGDIAELKSWSWYDATGGEPGMGGPGLWQPDSLPAGEPSS